MPTRTEYRHALAAECGAYTGPDNYEIRATSGSDTTKLVCDVYPIQSGIAQDDLYVDRPLYRPGAVLRQDRNRYIQGYDPPTGTITPDLPWIRSPLATVLLTTYDDLEAYMYEELELQNGADVLYEDLEGTGLTGIGEQFEILGPFDSMGMHQLINDGLKQCWLVVDVACIPTPGATRHSLALVAPWLQDPNHVRQAGVLAAGSDRNVDDPFDSRIYGAVERDGADYYFITDGRTFNDGDVIYLRCYKRAFDHCRASGGVFGEQSGLHAETDEGPTEVEWTVAAALMLGWRRFGHILEPVANQRLIRDHAAAAAWFSTRAAQHFTAVAPTLSFRRARSFGPAFR